MGETQRERYGDKIWEQRAAGQSFPDIADNLGIPASSTRRIWQEVRDEKEASGEYKWTDRDDVEDAPDNEQEKVDFQVDGFEAVASSRSPRIKSLGDLLAACNVDLSLWKVDRYIVNKWEIARRQEAKDMTFTEGRIDGHASDTGKMHVEPLWQVKAWLVPKVEEPYIQAFNAVLQRLENDPPKYDPPPKVNTDGAYLFVPNIYDAHIGKRSADGEYTVAQAAADFLKAARALAALARDSGRPVGRIMFPVGHDILHTDNLSDTTTKGTWVETAADIRDAVDAVCWVVPQAIEAFAEIAPVDVVPVESNHDRLQVHWLGQFLAAWFRNHPGVNVRTKRAERQYYQWQRIGFGLTHAKSKPDKLAMMMPVEEPALWAATTWREWLTGHEHTKQGMFYEVTEVAGVVIRVIPALCEPDTYHRLHLYVGNHRAAEGRFYHGTHGPAGDLPVFVDELGAS